MGRRDLRRGREIRQSAASAETRFEVVLVEPPDRRRDRPIRLEGGPEDRGVVGVEADRHTRWAQARQRVRVPRSVEPERDVGPRPHAERDLFVTQPRQQIGGLDRAPRGRPARHVGGRQRRARLRADDSPAWTIRWRPCDRASAEASVGGVRQGVIRASRPSSPVRAAGEVVAVCGNRVPKKSEETAASIDLRRHGESRWHLRILVPILARRTGASSGRMTRDDPPFCLKRRSRR